MKILLRFIALVHGLMAVVLVVAALLMLASAVHTGFAAVYDRFDENAALKVIEAVGLIAVAIVVLQIAQIVAEEEVIREAHVSGPTRVRRYLSRFLVVLTVALAIEALIATFRSLHDDISGLPYAASVIASVGLLLTGWGIFIRFNREAEQLEPEAMREAKREDRKLR